MNFQDDIRSIPIDNFKDHYAIASDLTSIQDATKKGFFHIYTTSSRATEAGDELYISSKTSY